MMRIFKWIVVDSKTENNQQKNKKNNKIKKM